jgi:hypothetical protein
VSLASSQEFSTNFRHPVRSFEIPPHPSQRSHVHWTRNAAGKLKAASNSMKNSDDFIEQLNPVTPSEVALVHQLIHLQIRCRVTDILAKQMIRDFVDRRNAKHGVKPKPPTPQK